MSTLEFYLNYNNIYEIYDDWITLFSIKNDYIYKFVYSRLDRRSELYRIKNSLGNLHKHTDYYERIHRRDYNYKLFMTKDLKSIMQVFSGRNFMVNYNQNPYFGIANPNRKLGNKIYVECNDLISLNENELNFKIVDPKTDQIYKLTCNYHTEQMKIHYINSKDELNNVKDIITRLMFGPKTILYSNYLKINSEDSNKPLDNLTYSKIFAQMKNNDIDYENIETDDYVQETEYYSNEEDDSMFD